MTAAAQALARLRAGNQRHAAGAGHGVVVTPDRREALLAGQRPFAAVLGCSDARVPVELVFDQGPGDLFVVRVAGAVAGPTQIASLEFAALDLGTRLIVVLGHSHCGAVLATLEQLRRPSGARSEHLRPIVECVRPAVEPLLAADVDANADALLRRAVRSNVQRTADSLRGGSPLLAGLARSDGLLIVGAEYALETGVVEFFDKAEAP